MDYGRVQFLELQAKDDFVQSVEARGSEKDGYVTCNRAVITEQI